jgi:hypothetical protein
LIYQSEYEQLLDICRQITTHRQQLAKPRIEAKVLRHIDPSVPNERLLAHLIAESLLKRIDRQLLESKNIFVQEFDIPQSVLFYSMAEAVPFVYAGHHLANQCLLAAAGGLESLTIFDIGMGNGKQVLQLLRLLSEKGGSARAVRVVGLDPVQQNIDSCRASIEALRGELPFRLEFHALCTMIEDLSAADYEFIVGAGDGALLINSAFTLHHISHPLNDQETRTGILRRLAALQPRILTLVEPSSDHDTEELPRRFHHCWQHFGNVFALVDEAGIDPSHKFLIKEKFFGREIRNIFGVSDLFRCERHELYDSWLLRLHRAGFRPCDHPDLQVQMPPYCRCSISEGLARLDYNDLTIVAVFAFAP